MAAVDETWFFTPTRTYEVAGKLAVIVEKQDREGYLCDVEERTTTYVDVATGLIVANRETFEAFIGPLDELLRVAAMREDGGYDS